MCGAPRATCPPRERESLTRRYTAEIMPLIGPDLDIPAPDLGTDEQTMAWMMDTYSMTQGRTVPGVVTGKPADHRRLPGRRGATGHGVAAGDRTGGPAVFDTTSAASGSASRASATSAAWWHAALCGSWLRVVGIADINGGIWNPDGLDSTSWRRT